MPDLHDIQGLVFSGYRRQPLGRVYFVDFSGGSPAPWLASLLHRVSTSELEARGDEPRLNVALTARGLAALGLDAEALASFPREFLQGMGHPERARVLGDVGANAPESWKFGGPRSGFDALVLSYARTEAELESEAELIEDGLDHFDLDAHEERVYLPDDGREHFGFADPRSNPRLSRAPRKSGSGSIWRRSRDDRAVPLGEFVLGYRNAYGRLASGLRAPIRHGTRPPPPLIDAGRAVDLGRNGTFVALRKFAQDVAGFRRFTTGAGAALWPRDPDPGARFAAALVGRSQDGASVSGCPVGAHVRRANPRDSLGDDAAASLAHVRAHRLVRRGRLFGPRLAPGTSDDGAERGLLFLALAADLARQFEFVVQSWLNEPKFAGLSGERDPLIGSALDAGETLAKFSLPESPLPREVPLERFVRVVGGEYLFLPGLRALGYLAEL